jgi:hypothetical protein
MASTLQKESSVEKRMIRLRPSDSLGDRLPAMHLVRSSWFARAMGKILFWYLLLFIIGSIFLPWQQSSRCEGVVTARNPNDRRQTFLSPAKGIIKKQKVGLQEGTWVEKGEMIMILDTIAEGEIQFTKDQLNQLNSQREFTRLQLEQAKDRIGLATVGGQLQIEAYESKVKAARAKWDQTKSEILGQRAFVAQAELERSSVEQVRARTRSEVEYQEAVNKLESENQKLLKLEQSADEAYQTLESEEKLLESKRQEVQDYIAKAVQDFNSYQGKMADYEKEISKLSIKLQELERTEIISPNSGWVQSIIGQVGRTVSNGEALFEIIPDTEDLWVELSVRGMDQPLVHIGDKVRIQFEGWPAVQFVGWPSIAQGTFGGVVNAINPADDGMGNFKIFVGPDPDDVTKEDWPSKDYLKQGVRANAWVLLDQVSLGFEIWRQVNGFPATRDLGDKGKKESEPKTPKLK